MTWAFIFYGGRREDVPFIGSNEPIYFGLPSDPVS